MKSLLRWEIWLHGLFGGFIGGGASAAGSWMGLTFAKMAGMDVPELNLKALGIIFVSGGLVNAFTYLKQSPLPALPDTSTSSGKDL